MCQFIAGMLVVSGTEQAMAEEAWIEDQRDSIVATAFEQSPTDLSQSLSDDRESLAASLWGDESCELSGPATGETAAEGNVAGSGSVSGADVENGLSGEEFEKSGGAASTEETARVAAINRMADAAASLGGILVLLPAQFPWREPGPDTVMRVYHYQGTHEQLTRYLLRARESCERYGFLRPMDALRPINHAGIVNGNVQNIGQILTRQGAIQSGARPGLFMRIVRGGSFRSRQLLGFVISNAAVFPRLARVGISAIVGTLFRILRVLGGPMVTAVADLLVTPQAVGNPDSGIAGNRLSTILQLTNQYISQHENAAYYRCQAEYLRMQGRQSEANAADAQSHWYTVGRTINGEVQYYPTLEILRHARDRIRNYRTFYDAWYSTDVTLAEEALNTAEQFDFSVGCNPESGEIEGFVLGDLTLAAMMHAQYDQNGDLRAAPLSDAQNPLIPLATAETR